MNAVMGRGVAIRGAVLAVVALLMALLLPIAVPAAGVGGATPASGQVGPANNTSATTTFDPVVGADQGGAVAAQCTPGQCSQYKLTIKYPLPDVAMFQNFTITLTYHCAWTSPANDDIDCFAVSPSGGQTGPGTPDTTNSGANFEDIVIQNPASGDWTLKAGGAVTPTPTTVTGTSTLAWTLAPHARTQVPRADDPSFANYDFDPGYQTRDALHRPNAGEPSLGVDRNTGAALFMAGSQVTQLTYSAASPPVPTALDVTPNWSQVNEDAILYTDTSTGRTWAIGLLLAGSYMGYTDDDGKTWQPGAAIAPPAAPDHETLGSGPYHEQQIAPPPGTTQYPNALYYCAQAETEAFCSRSDNGGVSFNSPAVALWNGACSALHGHVRVGPTGVVYVPNGRCTDPTTMKGVSGMAISVDNGQSFKFTDPPDSSPGTSDPSVAEGPDGKIYFGYQAANGHPMIAVGTHDDTGNVAWKPSVDVGAVTDPGQSEDGFPQGVQETEFAEVITGDANRAAFAYLGSSTAGAYQDGAYPGTWYLFVAYTYDGGKTWRNFNATPNLPVQRGCIWNGGLVNACRNLLDFNDIAMDKTGHVYVAYTDGCTATAQYNCKTTKQINGWNAPGSGGGNPATGCSPSEADMTVTSTQTCTFARLSAIVRQVCGKGLIASADPGFHEDPSCPAVKPVVVANPTPVPSPSVAPTPQPQQKPALVNTSALTPAAALELALVTLLVGFGAWMLRRREPA